MQDGVVTTRLPLTDIEHETLRKMHAYWLARGRGGLLPGRRDIDPLDFPWALGLVCLLDVEREPLRFRYRVDGTIIADRHGEDFTGRTTDEVQPDFYADMLHRHFSEVLQTRQPTLYRIVIRQDGQTKTYLRLALPLADDGVTVDKILTVSDRVTALPDRSTRRYQEERLR